MNNMRKIWEIDSCFKCPIAGYCLSLVEQRKILKNAGIKTKNMGSYELHQKIMANLHTECKISKSINKLLNQKYSKLIEKLALLNEKKFLKEWRKADADENLIPLFFIAISNKDYSVEFLSKVYGDMHMHGFLAANYLATIKKEAIVEKRTSLKYKALLRKEKQHTKQLTKEHRKSERMIIKLQALLKQESNKKHSLKIENENHFEVENKKLKSLNISQNKELLGLEREKRKAEINMFKAKSSVEQLTSELNQLIAQ
ncbi:MAG: hypothetical protein KAR45_19455, partial [Desulfobacteraceae bacterium]|nr:hypothetical protein [Desulfobacteraceae bacterium]